jgi:DUF1365 family protein
MKGSGTVSAPPGGSLNSCLYVGSVRHRRHEPAGNRFSYKLFMMYLDLAELPRVFEPYFFWSAKRAAPAWFKRDDYLHCDDDASLPLDESVRRLVTQHTGKRPAGPIRLLTHLRYFGYAFNPVSFYYCFDATGTTVQTIVAEITNTPWKERHAYVLPVGDSAGGEPLSAPGAWQFRFEKQFHVSPFMPMDMRYDWRFSAPSDGLHVHMENWRNGRSAFDATLSLRREPITSASLARALVGFPLMTAQVVTLIHWQALRLLAKRVPFITHPKKLTPTVDNARGSLPP